MGPACPGCPQEPGRGSPERGPGRVVGTLCSWEREPCPGYTGGSAWLARGPSPSSRGPNCSTQALTSASAPRLAVGRAKGVLNSRAGTRKRTCTGHLACARCSAPYNLLSVRWGKYEMRKCMERYGSTAIQCYNRFLSGKQRHTSFY